MGLHKNGEEEQFGSLPAFLAWAEYYELHLDSFVPWQLII